MIEELAMIKPEAAQAQMPVIGRRELDRRAGDGIDVALLWNVETKAVFVSVTEREGGWFEFEVPPGDALEAFHHPYVYAEYNRARTKLAA
jgi:hypothetical protein